MDQNLVWLALGLATLAGASIPLGAALARLNLDVFSSWTQTELRHGIMAFGAGALLSAIALVLVPEGLDRLSAVPAVTAFLVGGLGFALVDRLLSKSGSSMAQFLAMMMDYVPEALALGAVLSGDLNSAILVAALIALQNLPEGFNAMYEMSETGKSKPSLWLFVLMVPVGPIAAWIGITLPESFAPMIGAVMMFSAGGILYLMFQDIAPKVPVENALLPPLGAVLGFALGLAGDLMT